MCVGICQSSGVPSHLKPQAKISQNIPPITAHSAIYSRALRLLQAGVGQVSPRCSVSAGGQRVRDGSRRAALSHAEAIFGRALTVFLGLGV